VIALESVKDDQYVFLVRPCRRNWKGTQEQQNA
jgi:hypothetical protein